MLPDCIRLNRGNHESRQQNKLMGFEEEVLEGATRSMYLRGMHVFPVAVYFGTLQSLHIRGTRRMPLHPLWQ